MEEEKLEREYRNLFKKTRSPGQGTHRREVWAVLGVKTQRVWCYGRQEKGVLQGGSSAGRSNKTRPTTPLGHERE